MAESLTSTAMQLGLGHVNKLRKKRSRLLWDALRNGEAVQGYHRIVWDGEQCQFFFRETLICKWFPEEGRFVICLHEDFSSTIATTNNLQKNLEATVAVTELIEQQRQAGE